eukprot:GFKZ01004048.1.p1 GENE.GFKZ01004048.1~~GFKZ01004048.1.p1  ORF type:complete len:571 (+),score=84.53 GFKZ01004048.1:147-1715(+)
MPAFLPHAPSLVHLHHRSNRRHASPFHPPHANLQPPPPAKLPPPSPPSDSPSPPAPSSSSQPEPGIRLVAQDLRSVFTFLTSFFNPATRPKPRSATGARVATTYVGLLGAASRATGRVVIKLQAARGMLAGWNVLRPFQWQLGGAESREMWKGQVERFVRGSGGVAGVFEGVWGFVKGVLGVVEGAIGKGMGKQRFRAARKRMGEAVQGRKPVVPLGRRMRVRPHSGDPNYVVDARVEAFRRRARELGQAENSGVGGGKEGDESGSDGGSELEAGKGSGVLEGEVRAENGVSEERESAGEGRSRLDEARGAGTIVMVSENAGGVVLEKPEEVGEVVNAEMDGMREGLIAEAVGRIGENGYKSPGRYTSPVFSGFGEVLKRGATTALGVGVVAGTISALPGLVTGAAVFVAGGALMSARVTGVDVEARRLFRKSETGKVVERVVEGLGTVGKDGVVETKGRVVGEGQPAVLDVPVVGLVLGWLDDGAYWVEKVTGGFVGKVRSWRGEKVEGWELLSVFREKRK